jgi:hypothetical protein
MKRLFPVMLSLALLAGCQQLPLNEPIPMSNLTAADQTLRAPSAQFQESAQSKSVIVGSQVFASANGCQLIKRYRVVTNADFTGSLNLMKYRASLMGAKWITIVSHSEIDRHENARHLANEQIIYQDGYDLGSERYLTRIDADLYDCPCKEGACTTR